ncbi:MAG: hypothetical protein JWO86_5950 [Myxococcaceae bacterium]|jgi:hypothetical protein|nr:hypothetical protein [Myxococcaceae bacterium]
MDDDTAADVIPVQCLNDSCAASLTRPPQMGIQLVTHERTVEHQIHLASERLDSRDG